jgi:hypothetical protein
MEEFAYRTFVPVVHNVNPIFHETICLIVAQRLVGDNKRKKKLYINNFLSQFRFSTFRFDIKNVFMVRFG